MNLTEPSGPTHPPAGAGGRASPAFPLRAAAVDVGSNGIRYVIAEFSTPRTRVSLASERFAVRLATTVFTGARALSAEAMDAGVDAMSQIRRRMDDFGVSHYRAVATSAVRESRNGGEFVERVRRESGIHLETISGSQECRLVWKAVRERLPLGDDRWFLVDLGGGSVEVSVVDRDGILASESHTLGSVRLLQAFRDEAGSGRGCRELLERYVHMLKIPAAMAQWRPVGAIATGGNIEALAKLAKAPVDDRGVARLPLRDLRSVLARLEALDYEARIRDLGLREDRADVIVPAAVVYERVAELVEADAILVPGVGVREGLLLDLVDDLRDHVAHAGARDREVRAAAVSLGRRFLFDEPHAVHVAGLSLSLFDQLRSLHGLGDDLRRVLLVGALLHDIGQFVSYRRHHRHSWYLITNSELPDLSPDEVRMAALVARYHRRAEPSPEHPEFAPLPEEERSAVRVLSAILRVADSLDRGHSARVASVGVRVGPESVVLEAAMSGDVGLESWALRKKGRAFENVFGRELHLEPQLP